MKLPLVVSEEIKQALSAGQAIVALESTLITHGLPKPMNLEVALALENDIRTANAIPATICLIDGAIKVGLSADELAALAESNESIKASTRDLAYALASKKTAGTTVAATMHCAKLAGIDIFATGGIGGVHRGVTETFDISTDLIELARTPVNVVCSGCKNILDIEMTLEFLETHAVPVVAFGQQKFPAFYARESYLQAPMSVTTVAEAAAMIRQQRALGLNSSVVIANPVPKGQALPFDDIEQLIEQALTEAKQQHITGKATTPFLLQTLVRLGGSTVTDANIALLRNNARLAAEIARELLI